MAGGPAISSFGYLVGGMFIFNLVVGTGSLAMPYGWGLAGVIPGVALTLLIFVLAYICVTFVIEIQSHATAVIENANRSKVVNINEDKSESASAEREPVFFDIPLEKQPEEEMVASVESYNGSYLMFEDEGGKTAFIIKQIELGMMSEVFLGKVGKYFFYLILLVYLYGDLAIYAVTVPQSIADTLTPDGMYFGDFHIGYVFCYWFYLFVFSVGVLPFCFFTFTNTKYLQFFTIFCRNLAFFLMIAIACSIIFKGEGAALDAINYFEAKGIGILWGTIIYCFMCHHSIPGLISPLRKKRKVNLLMFCVYCGILTFYLLLSSTAVFAFDDTSFPSSCKDGIPCQIQQLYTQNFLSYRFKAVAYFLGLFPVFTLTSNYPLIAITLRNNMMKLFTFGQSWNPMYRQWCFAAIASMPSLFLAAVFTDVNVLVSFTGSYAGLFIEFIIPSCLVYYARKYSQEHFPGEINPYASPFKHNIWIIGILIVAAISLVVVTINNAYGIYERIETLINN